MWQNLSTREKRLIIVFLSLVFVMAAYSYVWKGQLPKWRQLTDAVQQQSLALRKEQAKAKRLPKLKQQSQQMDSEAQGIRQKFQITVTDGNPYVEMGFRSRERVSLVKVTPQPLINKGNYQVMPVQLELRGSYLGQLQFIEALENLPTMSEITSISMKAVDNGPYPELQSGMTLLLFSLNDAVSGKLRGQWELGRFDIFSPTFRALLDKVQPATGEQAAQPTAPTPSKPKPANGTGTDKPVYHFPVR